MKKQKKQALVVTVTLAMLVAISIVMGKFLAIRGGDILRFSFVVVRTKYEMCIHKYTISGTQKTRFSCRI